VRLLGCEIDRLDMSATLARCIEIVERRETVRHLAINAAKIVALHDDERLRDATAGCALINADGQAVVWASRLLGDPLPERVAGIDLMQGLLALSAERGYGVFFLGAREPVLQRALERIRSDHPNLRIAGAHHGHFADTENADVCAEIEAVAPDILFVAMSSPRKEYWLGENASRLGTPLAMGVGGTLDVLASATRRAPRWAQRAGLEWAFRLLQEPRRLFGRYLKTNVRFVWLVARELAARWTRRR